MSDMKSFLIQNGIIATTAGITIGFATATFVKSFVSDVILPVIFMVVVKGTGTVSKDTSSFFSRFLSKKEFLFTNFISETITWLAIVLLSYVILQGIYTNYIRKPNTPGVAQEFSNPFAPKHTRETFQEQQSLW